MGQVERCEPQASEKKQYLSPEGDILGEKPLK